MRGICTEFLFMLDPSLPVQQDLLAVVTAFVGDDRP